MAVDVNSAKPSVVEVGVKGGCLGVLIEERHGNSGRRCDIFQTCGDERKGLGCTYKQYFE